MGCPKCGSIEKYNYDKAKSLIHCFNCGTETPAKDCRSINGEKCPWALFVQYKAGYRFIAHIHCDQLGKYLHVEPEHARSIEEIERISVPQECVTLHPKKAQSASLFG